MRRLLLIALVALALAACGQTETTSVAPTPTVNINQLFVRCVENAAAHGDTAQEARAACEGWR